VGPPPGPKGAGSAAQFLPFDFYREQGIDVQRVLIADDNSIVRNIIKHFLSHRPNVAICGEAGNGCELVEKAKLLKPDLVLLDLAMPEMNGAEAASVLKKSMPDLPIILFTMYSEKVSNQLKSAIGVDAVLSKPDGLTKLAKVVDAVLARCPPEN
jgi:DNA-binding NarL/FixJ family response regulator